MEFVNLHAHSHYSLLDGFGSPEDIILRSKELGYKAAALTDHGVTYGLIEFYKKAKEHGIKPILGSELYVSPRTRFDKEAKIDTKPFHLTVLAKDFEGYQNLLRLVTKAHTEGFYYKPRIDLKLLKVYSKGLLAFSGCLAGQLPRAILSEDENEIKKVVETYIDIFGKEDFYLEMQDHPLIENQSIVNEKLKSISRKYGLQLVVTNDSHYPRPEDSDVHDILLCIQTQTNINDENRMRYVGDYSIRDVSDLKQAFKDCPEAITNTAKIAEKCNIEFEFGNNLIPSYSTPQNESPGDYLKELCFEGLKNRFENKDIPKNYSERLDYELDTVHKMGFDTYFLIVSDFVRYAKNQKIVVGPGRGSAAGSIIAWALDITDVDPISNGLFFERFLNPERVSMPDIDIDFADTRRDEVLTYVVEKYGRDNVAQIITFGTMAPRAAVRDAGRALGYPYSEVDKIAKTIPPPILGKHTPLIESIKEDPELKQIYDKDKRAQVLLDYAKKLEGTVRHSGTHACAVVIADKPLTDYTALQFAAGDSQEIVTQYSAKPLEDLGLLKMDFLGLKNLTVIEKTGKILKRTQNLEIDINDIPFDDEKTFKLLQQGDTTGVFQLESAGMKRYLKDLKPTVFEDIVAMGALYRPGPMEWIPTYIKGKHNPKKVKYLHKSFKSILETTYGVAVYQEQILQLARDFAGFSLGEADILRKAVGKKIPALLAEQREKFIKGAIKKEHSEKFAKEVFEKVIEPFAGYGFNKAHAVCYGVIAYQTAYLKAHFPVEFMTALLCSDSNNTDRVVIEIKECNEMGINVLPPSINESFSHFTVIDNKTIRFGLLAIKGVGEGPIKEIITVRDQGGNFTSLENFASRVPTKILNKKLIQALAYSGAFDQFGDRNQIAENFDEIAKYSKSVQEHINNGQTNIFGLMEDDSDNIDLNLRPVPKVNQLQKLLLEKQFLGMYVSGHPLKGLTRYISKKANLIGKMTLKNLNKTVKCVGLITDVKRFMTKSGGYMLMFTLEDTAGKVNAVMFPKVFSQFGSNIVSDQIVALSGKLDNRRGSFQLIIDNCKPLSLETMIENAKEQNYYSPDEKANIHPQMLDDILEEHELPVEKNTGIPNVFKIEIYDNVSKVSMEALKNLLLKNGGNTDVELLLSNSRKRIKLPFKINLTKELEKKISSLLS